MRRLNPPTLETQEKFAKLELLVDTQYYKALSELQKAKAFLKEIKREKEFEQKQAESPARGLIFGKAVNPEYIIPTDQEIPDHQQEYVRPNREVNMDKLTVIFVPHKKADEGTWKITDPDLYFNKPPQNWETTHKPLVLWKKQYAYIARD